MTQRDSTYREGCAGFEGEGCGGLGTGGCTGLDGEGFAGLEGGAGAGGKGFDGLVHWPLDCWTSPGWQYPVSAVIFDEEDEDGDGGLKYVCI